MMEGYEEYRQKRLEALITHAHNTLEGLQAEYRKLVGKDYRVIARLVEETARKELE
jgi:hypothetical protein